MKTEEKESNSLNAVHNIGSCSSSSQKLKHCDIDEGNLELGSCHDNKMDLITPVVQSSEALTSCGDDTDNKSSEMSEGQISGAFMSITGVDMDDNKTTSQFEDSDQDKDFDITDNKNMIDNKATEGYEFPDEDHTEAESAEDDESSNEFANDTADNHGKGPNKIKVLLKPKPKKEKSFVCDICNRRCIRQHDLKIHLMSHTGEKPWTCEICKKSFTIKSSLKTHMIIHSGERNHKCHICEKAYARAASLRIHLSAHAQEKPHQCKVCFKSFSSKGYLTNHMNVHGETLPYQCSICDKGFIRSSQIKAHLKIHARDPKNVPTCELCGKTFVSDRSLPSHYQHHAGVKPYECVVCKASFTLPGTLKNHMWKHADKRPFSCHICHETFFPHIMLHRHHERHVHPFKGKLAYVKCSYCEKEFGDKEKSNQNTGIDNPEPYENIDTVSDSGLNANLPAKVAGVHDFSQTSYPSKCEVYIDNACMYDKNQPFEDSDKKCSTES